MYEAPWRVHFHRGGAEAPREATGMIVLTAKLASRSAPAKNHLAPTNPVQAKNLRGIISLAGSTRHGLIWIEWINGPVDRGESTAIMRLG